MANKPTDAGVLDRLFATIESRRGADPAESYTAQLLAEGTVAITKKVSEEALETVTAAEHDTADAVARESADLLYHLLVLWAARGVSPGDVWAELDRREGTSGLAEKASRSNDDED